jgi:hypothetical protein
MKREALQGIVTLKVVWRSEAFSRAESDRVVKQTRTRTEPGSAIKLSIDCFVFSSLLCADRIRLHNFCRKVSDANRS